MKISKTVIFILLIGNIFIVHSCFEKSDHSINNLEKRIIKKFKSVSGTFALAYKDITDSSKFIFYNENISFHAASTMKTPVMYEVFKQSKEGKFKLIDSLKVKNEFYSIIDSSLFKLDFGEDSHEKLYKKIGATESIFNLCYEMIIQSSNLATNILIDLVEAKKVTESMREIKARNIHVLRGVEDIKAYRQGKSNTTTALDLLLLFDKLGKYELIDSSASKKMIEILIDQNFNEIIPAKLPQDVIVAHKTGAITKVMHDTGLVILPNGQKYSIILLSKDWDNKEIARETMAEVSKMIFDFYKSN